MHGGSGHAGAVIFGLSPLWVATLLFVATYVVIMSDKLNRAIVALLPLWWALSLGACLGGNGTLIGASANLVVAGLAERAGTGFRFITYLKVAFPLMLISIVLSHAYLYWRFL
jgi:Na+/H+ antiporter NhaD/arsenite permease-like protein